MPSHSHKHLTHPEYRPDIDGLRAIAVLSVVGFHAIPNTITGGFIGVDIFFVISGFLISSIIFSNLEHDSFSLVAFYSRRVKRIFPALLLVLIACFAIGWFVMLAEEFKQLGKHIAGSAGFVSNFILWQESGYFDNAADTKPLLHLWSLAIEEQFYIFWPLLLAFVWKRQWSFVAITATVASLSFVANIYLIYNKPTMTFYFPATRFWELMIGGLLAHIALHKPHLNSRYKNAQSILGAMLLVLGLAFLNKERAFPGWWALLPTLGAFCMISAGPAAWLNKYVLSNKLLVGIGLISYPLYLWHWPLLSFARILKGETPTREILIGVVLASILLAWLTCIVFERPIRYGRHNRVMIIPLMVIMVVVGGAGYTSLQGDGLAYRSVVKANKLLTSGPDGWDEGKTVNECGISNGDDKKLLGACLQDSRQPPKYALLGDSKAGAIFGGLVRTSSDNGRWLFIGGMAPVLSKNKSYQPVQKPITIAINSIIQNKNIEAVALVTSTRGLFHLANAFSIEDLPASKNYDLALDGLNNVIQILVKNDKKVIIVVDNPTLPDPKDCIERFTGFEHINQFIHNNNSSRCNIDINRHLELSSKYRNLLLEVQKDNHGDVTIFDTLKYMCDIEKGVCSPHKNGRLLYSYTDHISDYAAGLIGKDLNYLLNNTISKSALRHDSPHHENSPPISQL